MTANRSQTRIMYLIFFRLFYITAWQSQILTEEIRDICLDGLAVELVNHCVQEDVRHRVEEDVASQLRVFTGDVRYTV